MAHGGIISDGTPREIFWDLETLENAMLKQPYVSRVLGALGIRGGIISIEDAVEGILNR